jgi:hypothetical protein
MPPPQGDGGRLLGASIHRRTSSDRHARWHARRRGACGAVEAIAGNPERVEELRMVIGRSLSLLERDIPVSHDSVGKSGRVPEQQEPQG